MVILVIIFIGLVPFFDEGHFLLTVGVIFVPFAR